MASCCLLSSLRHISACEQLPCNASSSCVVKASVAVSFVLVFNPLASLPTPLEANWLSSPFTTFLAFTTWAACSSCIAGTGVKELKTSAAGAFTVKSIMLPSRTYEHTFVEHLPNC